MSFSIDYSRCHYPQLIEGCRIEAQMCAEMGNNLQKLIPAVQQHGDGLNSITDIVCNLMKIADNLTSLAIFHTFPDALNFFSTTTIVHKVLRELLPSMRRVLAGMDAQCRSSSADDREKWRLIFHNSTPGRPLLLPSQFVVYAAIISTLVDSIKVYVLIASDICRWITSLS